MGMEPHCCLVGGVNFLLGLLARIDLAYLQSDGGMAVIRFHYRGARTLQAIIADFLCFLAILGSLWWTWWVFSYPMK